MSTPIALDPVADVLFGKGRRLLLSILFSRPDQSYYLRELARLTAASPGTLVRELRALTKVGLVLRQPRGRQVFFQANSAIPVFGDLRGLLEKTMGGVDALRAALAPLADRIDLAFVFGSMASGRLRPTSDIDLLIVGEVEFAEVTDALAPVEPRLGREVNPTVYSRAEFRRRVAGEGHFVTAVLNRPQIPILGDLQHELGRLVGKPLARAAPNQSGRNRRAARRRRSKPR